MRLKIFLGAATLLLGAGLSGCTSNSPPRPCLSPLVRVNAVAPAGDTHQGKAGPVHE